MKRAPRARNPHGSMATATNRSTAMAALARDQQEPRRVRRPAAARDRSRRLEPLFRPAYPPRLHAVSLRLEPGDDLRAVVALDLDDAVLAAPPEPHCRLRSLVTDASSRPGRRDDGDRLAAAAFVSRATRTMPSLGTGGVVRRRSFGLAALRRSPSAVETRRLSAIARSYVARGFARQEEGRG